MTLKPGDTLLNGQYRILRQLGRGGFGFVYQAQDVLLSEQVAIKELIPALVGDEEMLRRFLAEAKATMRLTHRRIVRTHNVFGERDSYFIVMEFMPGASLEAQLAEHRPVPAGEAARIAAEVCEGLSCAHEQGVVHCDLKPANILFAADGSAKVADFGIAHISGEMLTRSWHTPAGFVAGTLPYMSPEQVEGVRDDPRIDIYAVGAVLFRMLTGHTYLDFDLRETPRAQADNVQLIYRQPPPPPSAYNRQVPIWLDQVVLRALAKRADERYAHAEDMRAALLQRAPSGGLVAEPPRAEPLGAKPRLKRPLGEPGSSAREAAAAARPVTPPPQGKLTPRPAQAKGKPARSRLIPVLAMAAVMVVVLLGGLVVGLLVVPSLLHGTPTPSLAVTSPWVLSPSPVASVTPPPATQAPTRSLAASTPAWTSTPTPAPGPTDTPAPAISLAGKWVGVLAEDFQGGRTFDEVWVIQQDTGSPAFGGYSEVYQDGKLVEEHKILDGVVEGNTFRFHDEDPSVRCYSGTVQGDAADALVGNVSWGSYDNGPWGHFELKRSQ